MRVFNKIAQYKEYKSGVKHCTFNPDGPGVVRIHLIPPKFRLFGNAGYIVILNGYYLLPLGYSWALMLSCFMEEVNMFSGKPISDDDYGTIFKKTVSKTHKVYPTLGKKEIEADLYDMLDIIFTVAKGENPRIDIEKMSLRSYEKNMTAPHRVDLMVSAMTDGEGAWRCNQRCLFCYAAGEHMSRGEELSCDEWKRAIDKLRDAGVPMITFTGGEPTLREDLCELIEYSKWFVTRLNTNGVLLTPELADNLRKASLDSVQITLYSHDEKTHNSLVGSEHFADTVQGIRNAVEIGLDVSINTPLCRKNADYIETLKFVRALGVRFVTASGLICTGTAGINHAEYDLDENELYEIIKAAKAYCDENGMEIDFTSPGLIANNRLEELSMNVPSCGACLSNMAISPDGTVIPCQSWLRADAGLGNILADDWRQIWAHKTCVKLRGMSDGEALGCPFRKGDA
ncbi:MAG: radical SAM protein [Clostridia bacterium]|nr:radical SAM protein [Clostridia bacterium]